MANSRLSMRKILEVLRLHHEGNLSHREIARAISASPTTVGEILRRAKLAGVTWPLPAAASEAALEARLYPPPAPSRQARPEPAAASGRNCKGGHVDGDYSFPIMTL